MLFDFFWDWINERDRLMSDGELISIIVPVYNIKNYVERCIGSLVSQTYHNLEIILVDDGSTDGSGEICDQYMQQMQG